MSDLQCPARLFLLRPATADVARVAEQLAGERLVAVHEEDEVPPDLAELADRHRGEAVLVVTDHPYSAPLVLLERDADGERVSPREITPG